MFSTMRSPSNTSRQRSIKQGNSAGLLSGMEQTYLEKIGSDEAYHVAALTDTIKKLGGTPVAAPGVDFGSSFDSRKNYLTTSHTFENVGVGAYLGAAGVHLRQDDPAGRRRHLRVSRRDTPPSSATSSASRPRVGSTWGRSRSPWTRRPCSRG